MYIFLSPDSNENNVGENYIYEIIKNSNTDRILGGIKGLF